MLKEWQFNVLFFVGVGSAVLLLFGPGLGLKISENPTAVTGVGAILTYILTQKKTLTKPTDKKFSLPWNRVKNEEEDEKENTNGL